MVRDHSEGGGNALLLTLVGCKMLVDVLGMNGWNEGFDLQRISLGIEFPYLNASCIHEALLCIAWLRCVTRAESKDKYC